MLTKLSKNFRHEAAKHEFGGSVLKFFQSHYMPFMKMKYWPMLDNCCDVNQEYFLEEWDKFKFEERRIFRKYMRGRFPISGDPSDFFANRSSYTPQVSESVDLERSDLALAFVSSQRSTSTVSLSRSAALSVSLLRTEKAPHLSAVSLPVRLSTCHVTG